MGQLAGTTAAILAGGLGTRLQPVVADRPKVLATVGGRPFITYLFDRIAAVQIDYVVCCTGYLGDQLRRTLGDRYGTLRLVYSEESHPLGTAGALRNALPLLQSDPVLVLNGDSICNLDLADFWRFHQLSGAAGSIALVEVEDTRRYGRAYVQADGAISGFAEKADTEGPGAISAGVYLFSHRLLRSIPADRPVSLEQETLPFWVGRGLYGYRSQAGFLDIGTPESYATSERFLASGR